MIDTTLAQPAARTLRCFWQQIESYKITTHPNLKIAVIALTLAPVRLLYRTQHNLAAAHKTTWFSLPDSDTYCPAEHYAAEHLGQAASISHARHSSNVLAPFAPHRTFQQSQGIGMVIPPSSTNRCGIQYRESSPIFVEVFVVPAVAFPLASFPPSN